MRTLRVMRPLRAVSALPSLQMVTNSVVGAIPSLFNVLLFLLFVFACFAVMAVQLWAGVMRGTCMTFDGEDWVLTDPEQVCSVPCSEYAAGHALHRELWPVVRPGALASPGRHVGRGVGQVQQLISQ